jgi:ABC-type branched-subunit amino acid transport system substrate-binding protein
MAALAAALSVALVACDGDDEAEPTPTAAPATATAAPATATAAPEPTATPTEEPTPTAAPEPQGEQFKIGFLADFSGPIAEFGPAIQTGVDLAVQHINAAGGVNGQDVVVVTGDTRVDPTQGVEEARRLIEVEGVHAIVGPLSSTVTLAVAESVAGPAGIPVISPSATSPALSVANDNGYLFRSTTSDAAQGVILAGLATEQGYDNIGVLFRDDAYGQGLSDAFAAAFGGTATTVAYSADGQISYLAELQQAADAGATVLVAVAFPDEALVFIREAIENDIFSTFLFVDGTKSQDLIDGIGAEYLNGMFGTAPGAGPGTASLAAWDAAYMGEHGELPTLPFVREAYDAVIALALAAEAAGSTEGAAIRDQLPLVGAPGGITAIPGVPSMLAALENVRNGEDINYEGAATSLDWNDVGDVTSGFIEIWQYAEGEIVSVTEVPFSLE